jgi:hypothetical protein
MVRPNDSAAYMQSHPHTVGLGRHEAVEYAFRIFLCDSGPGIFYVNLHLSALFYLSLYAYLA